MAREVTLDDGIRVSIQRLYMGDENGKPRFQFYIEGVIDEFDMYVGIDDIYKIRNMINSELDDAYVPVVTDPEDAA